MLKNMKKILLHNAKTNKIFLFSYYTNENPSSKLAYGVLNSVKFEKEY